MQKTVDERFNMIYWVKIAKYHVLTKFVTN